MKKCLDCGEIFAEDQIQYRKEDVGECQGLQTYQTVSCCPCGSDDIIEAEQCSICGKWFDEDDLEAGACPTCRSNTVRAFQKVCAAEFSREERKIINQAYDGEEIFTLADEERS